ncbi:O-antigen ligase family protein [Flavobacterium procerum]|uniref:O-antigen ligase family protein n=1 Tax=Flavobacterium procerum TaxID=1455569 RepID=A0ABV6BM06_9FLAO
MILKNKVLFVSRLLGITAVIILVLVVPQINIRDYAQSTITSKFVIFQYIIISLIVLCISEMIYRRERIFLLSKIDFVLLILAAYIIVNRYFIQPHYGFSIRFMELLGLGLFYFILRLNPFRHFFWLLLCILISGIIQALHGCLQLLGFLSSNHSGFKITGSFFNPGPYAGFLATVWIIAFGVYLFNEKIVDQLKTKEDRCLLFVERYSKGIFLYIPLLALWSISMLLFVLQSRASWLAVLVSGGMLADLKFHFFRKLKQRIVVTYTKIALLALSVVIVSIISFAIYNHKKKSSEGRAFIWKISSEMISDSPFFGVGFDRFKAHYMVYQANYFKENDKTSESYLADNTYYAFNEFIQFTAENGFIGFLLLLVLIYIIFSVSTEPELELHSQIIKSVLLGMLIFSFISYPMQILPIKVIMYFLLAQLANLDSKKSKFIVNDNLLNKRVENSFKVFIAAISIVFITGQIMHTIQLQGAFKNWNDAQKRYNANDYATAVKIYGQAYPFLYNEGDFLMNYGKALSLSEQNKQAIDIFKQAKRQLNTTIIQTGLGDAYKNEKQYDEAVLAYQNAYYMIPSRFYPLYLTAKLYEQTGEHEKAVDAAEKILQKEVKIYSTAIGEMRDEMKEIIAKYGK